MSTAYKQHTFLQHFFESHAQTNPEQIAVQSHQHKLTYQTLNERANQIAWRLSKRGIGSGHLIGVLFERGMDIYATLLGILKVGAAYVPLDPSYPLDRIQYILDDSGVQLLITNIHNYVGQHPCMQLALEQSLINAEPTTPLISTPVLNAHALCYVIYTSGTTGRPKGVKISHKNVCNYIAAASKVYQLQPHDRVYQGFSVAFDASVEEIWMSLANGATLIPGIEEMVYSGAELMPYLHQHQVTVFSCVPTLLSMLEMQHLPSLRLLILGGEACPEDLITHWTRPDLTILNTYGPTETTVVATYAHCHPGQPITIGKPLDNYEIWLMNDQMQPVVAGEEGELYIAGDSVSAGYINQPELNATRFITHPTLGKRLYRTGDRGKCNSQGDIVFTGRVDRQVKLRGFRVELGEVEEVVRQSAGIKIAAAVVLELSPGVPSLVVYVVPKKSHVIDQAILLAELRCKLPHYMTPQRIEVLDKMPLLSSGKVDYKLLPSPTLSMLQTPHTKKESVQPETALQKTIAASWQTLFHVQSIGINDHFFYDLGGHSLLAAKVVSLLRQNPSLQALSMRDLYAHPTIASLAVFAESISATETIQTKSSDSKKQCVTPISQWRYLLCATGQLFGCVAQFFVLAWEALFIIWMLHGVMVKYGALSLPSILTYLGIITLLPLLMLGLAVALKWLIIGRFKAGRYRLWGGYYFRWWLVTSLIRLLVPVRSMIGTPLMSLYCRAMGARVGKRCVINSDSVSSFDLITLGDDTSINNEAALLGYSLEQGCLILGPVTIGANCYVGTGAVLDLDTSMDDCSVLEDLSLLRKGQAIPSAQTYRGSPATLDAQATATQHPARAPSRGVMCGFGVLHYLGLITVNFVHLLAYIPAYALIEHFYTLGQLRKVFYLGVPLGALLFILTFCGLLWILKQLLLTHLKPGTYSVYSLTYFKTWLFERVWNISELRVLGETIFFPPFLRLLGASIGKGVELAEFSHAKPPLMHLKDGAFAASWVTFGASCIHLGRVTYGLVVLGQRTFVGNGAIISNDAQLGDQCLLGSLSISPADGEKRDKTVWFGSPPMLLPRREEFHQFSETDTFSPSKLKIVQRGLFELFRMAMPISFLLLTAVGFFMSYNYLVAIHASRQHWLWLFPLLDLSVIYGLVVLTIGVKWVTIGRFKETMKPLWSSYIWKTDLIDAMHYVFLAPVGLTLLLGTPFASFLLRGLGVKIGKRACILADHGFIEYDLITLGHDVMLHNHSLFLTHLYEDRIFKTGPIKIADQCSIGERAYVLYHTIMHKQSTLGHLSLLMKGEELPANTTWHGLPAQLSTEQK